MELAPSARAAIPAFLVLFALFTPASIAGAHLSLGVAVLLLALDPEGRAKAAALARTHPLRWPIAAWIVASVLAVALAIDPAGSAEKLKKLALLVLLPLGALPQVRRAIRPIMGTLIGATAIVAAWGLGAHVAAGGGLEQRLHGISGFYMTVAAILMVVALLVIGEFLAALRAPSTRRVVFLSVCGAVILVALLATYTRGSWVGFALGALWLFRRRWTALLSLAVVAGLFFVLGPADARDRVLSIFDPHHPRNAERLLIWRHGVSLVAERPIFGAGLVIPAEIMEHEVVTPDGTIRVHSHMHNAFLQIAVSMGLPALAVFAWWMVELFRAAGRAARHTIRNLWEEGLVLAYPAILVALLANGLFEWNFGDSEVLGLLYLLTGCLLGVETGAES
ncbi:MAG: O-antigen ligase family protein [bacterium]